MRVSLDLSPAEVEALQRVAKKSRGRSMGKCAWAVMRHIVASGYVEPRAQEPYGRGPRRRRAPVLGGQDRPLRRRDEPLPEGRDWSRRVVLPQHHTISALPGQAVPKPCPGPASSRPRHAASSLPSPCPLPFFLSAQPRLTVPSRSSAV